MNIRIPLVLVWIWNRLCDWGNVPIGQIGKFELVRLDIFIALFGIFSVAWYGYWYGWRGALQGGVAYVVVGALALFVRRG